MFFLKSIRKIIYLKDRIPNLKCVPIKLEKNFKKGKMMLVGKTKILMKGPQNFEMFDFLW